MNLDTDPGTPLNPEHCLGTWSLFGNFFRHFSDGLIFDYTPFSSVSDWLIISVLLVDGGLCSVVDPDPH